MAVFKNFWGNKTIKKEKNNRNKATNGNAMIYVLIAIALFGFLTATLSNQNNQADGQDLDDEMVEFYANELIEYAAAAKNVVDQMIMTGSNIDDLDFINPTSAGFDTPPHIHKVFHPQGGGLNYQETFSEAIQFDSAADWDFSNDNNIEWTPSAQNDVIVSAIRIVKPVCEALNKKITGSTTIPVMTESLNRILVAGAPIVEFTTTVCSDCEGYSTLCVESSSGTFAFYTILAAR